MPNSEGSDQDDSSDARSASSSSSDDSSSSDEDEDDSRPFLGTPPSFVGGTITVPMRSVFEFKASALKKLGDMLRPYESATRTREAVVLSVNSDGVVSLRIVSSILALSRTAEVYTMSKTGSVVLVSNVPGRDKIVATNWSGGRAVYWELTERSQFFSSAPMSVLCNHDFELYDPPEKYLGVIELNRTSSSSGRLVCEAFICDVLHQKRGARHGERVDKMFLSHPVPARPLQRPTDIGFAAAEDTIDARSARRFVSSVMRAYAPLTGVATRQSWTDPIRAGTWDEVCAKLMWLLLQLDEDDLHGYAPAGTFAGSANDHGTILPGAYITTLLLHAPWFVTANVCDAIRGSCVPFGSTTNGANAWWDTSIGQWKSSLGVRGFSDVHTEKRTYQCDHTCDMTQLVKDHHAPVDRRDAIEVSKTFDDDLHDVKDPKPFALVAPKLLTSVAHVTPDLIYQTGFVILKCDACGKVYKDLDDDVFVVPGLPGISTKPAIVCTTTGCPGPPLRALGYRLQAKCMHPQCFLYKKPALKCDCSMGEQLAHKQSRDTKSLVAEVIDYKRTIQRRIKKCSVVELLVRKQALRETTEEHRAYTNFKVDEVISRSRYSRGAVSLRCRFADEKVSESFEEDLSEESDSDFCLVRSRRIIEDTYKTMAMNAKWNVVRFTRDALLVEFDGMSRTSEVTCGECTAGFCEVWDDGLYHCVACRRSKDIAGDADSKRDSIADVDVSTTASEAASMTYSIGGVDVGRHDFLEHYMRNMTRLFF